MRFPDTIYALSSGGLPSGVAVVRISGELAGAALHAIAGGLPEERAATLRTLRDENGTSLDRALILYFAGPRSETGENMAELQLHGGKAVVAAVLGWLGRFPGCRHAEAGEFARRALLNGKLDLTQVEALGDLVAAETESQRRQALANAGGAQSRLYNGWRDQLVDWLALVEAELDFADEDDIPGGVSAIVWPQVANLAREVERHVAGFHAGELVREGFQVVILGPPNAGKSSLLNALAAREVAIVSDQPGTTRDLVEVALDAGGFKVVVTDTAGVRDADGVEAIGVRRGLERARMADLVLSLLPAGDPGGFVRPPDGVTALQVRTKSDLRDDPQAPWSVSTVTGFGVDSLITELGRRAAAAGRIGAGVVPTRSRQRDLVFAIAGSLRAAAVSEDGLELRVEFLRAAAANIGRLTGRIDVEDVLDRVFSTFCVGK
ncbi:MAG: tRNA uridine-5-carboxymethylaminomethyl(34) synthesis GTPase MnmE [Rhizobiaceae bacterium]